MFDAISFAGGGNRCYWQGGFVEAMAGRLELKPKLAVEVSAGACTNRIAATQHECCCAAASVPMFLPRFISSAKASA
jgi:hypothetical protein